MLFAITCVDKPDHAQVRAANRPDHLAFLKGQGDRVVLAGPTQTDDGDHMTGSLIVIEAPDRAAAEAFCAADPYTKAGLFDSVTVRRWKQVLPPL